MINMAYAFQNELTPDEMKIKVKGKGRREPSESSVRKAKPSGNMEPHLLISQIEISFVII